MPGSHLLCTATVVPGSYRNAAGCSSQLDPEVSGRSACRITFVIISWTHRRTVCARIGSFNSQVVGHQEVDLWRGNTGDECSQRLGEPDGISAPQGADNVSDIG